MIERESVPEETGDDKSVSFYESEECKRRFEAGLEAALREKAHAVHDECVDVHLPRLAESVLP